MSDQSNPENTSTGPTDQDVLSTDLSARDTESSTDPIASTSSVPDEHASEPTFPPSIGVPYVARDAHSITLDTTDPLSTSASADMQESRSESDSKLAPDIAATSSASDRTVEPTTTPTDKQGSSSDAQPGQEKLSPPKIFGVILVDFDHALGPKIEWSSPATLKEDHRSALDELPFLALPDGAHAREEDYSYFHLHCPSLSQQTVFGISCNRQIAANKLLVKAEGVTRSTVQKAIVVLASQPVFGPIRDKLGVITKAFFEQKDFQDTSILSDFHHSLEDSFSNAEIVEDSVMNMGTALRELVYTFRLKVLQLFKVLMLQKRIMFYGSHVEKLCTFQYSLVSLIPGLLLHLEDAGDPELNSRAQVMEKAQELKSSDKRSFLRYLGLPLNVFGAGAFFQPYLPLQQIENLQAQSYLVGTTNSIFQQQKDCRIDVLVNIDTGSIDVLDPSLAVMITLTPEDRAWMDEVVRTVTDTWNAADPGRPHDMKFVGSDDYLRAKFEEYICSVLSAIKFVDFLEKGKASQVLISSSELSAGLSSYNQAWVAGFQMTPAFAYWDTYVDPVIFDLVEPRHPAQGSASVLSDVGLRLMQGVHDLKLDETLGPARDYLGKGIQSGTQSVWGMLSAVRNDIAKRQSLAVTGGHVQGSRDSSKRNSTASVSSESGSQPQQAPSQVLQNVGDYASSLGSFFSSKKNQFFSAPSTSASVEASQGQSSAKEQDTSPALETPAGRATPHARASMPPSTGGGFFNRYFSSSSSGTGPSIPQSTSTPVIPISTAFNSKVAAPPPSPSFFQRLSGADTSQVKSQAPLKELSLAPKSNSTTLTSPQHKRTSASPRLSPSSRGSPTSLAKARRASTASTASSSAGSQLSQQPADADDFVSV